MWYELFAMMERGGGRGGGALTEVREEPSRNILCRLPQAGGRLYLGKILVEDTDLRGAQPPRPYLRPHGDPTGWSGGGSRSLPTTWSTWSSERGKGGGARGRGRRRRPPSLVVAIDHDGAAGHPSQNDGGRVDLLLK